MFVQNAKSRENKEDENDKSSDTQNNSNSLKVKNTNLEAKFLARKVRKPLNRKPLYPGAKKKSSKTSTTKNTAESSPNIYASFFHLHTFICKKEAVFRRPLIN